MKKLLAMGVVLCLAGAAWAQGAQSTTSGSVTAGAQAGQQQPAQPAPPAPSSGNAGESDAQVTRPQPGQTPGTQTDANAPAQAPAAGAQPGSSGAAAATMVHAELAKTVDAKKAKVGDEVVAKTTTEFRTANGTRVPAGSKLLGKVTEAQARDKKQENSESRLAFTFDRAVLKDKTEIPVQVVVQAVGAAQTQAMASGPEMGGPADVGGGPSGSGPGMVGGTVGAAGQTVGGVAGGAGQTVGGVAGSTVGTATGAAGDVAGSTTGAVGAGGRLSAQSQGVIGLEGIQLQSSASSSTQAAVLTSADKNVKLNSGTQLVLRVSAQ